VEQELLAHPAIEDVAVIGVPDESFGERLRAYIQLQAGSELNEEMLRVWLRSRVARYQMPRDIFFIPAIPYTSVGKKDKKRLKVE
jgi:non-ribosomal peptide synthetase component E (peptide arylation enzyme)